MSLPLSVARTLTISSPKKHRICSNIDLATSNISVVAILINFSGCRTSSPQDLRDLQDLQDLQIIKSLLQYHSVR